MFRFVYTLVYTFIQCHNLFKAILRRFYMEEEIRMDGSGSMGDPIREKFTCNYCPYFSAPGHYCNNPNSIYEHDKIDSALPLEVLFRGCSEIPRREGEYLPFKMDISLAKDSFLRDGKKSRVDLELLRGSEEMANLLWRELVKIRMKRTSLDEITLPELK